MTKKQIKNLVLQSYTKDRLDEKKVYTIARFLKRHEFKQYLNKLKGCEKQKTLIIEIPHLPTTDEQNKIKTMFKDKKIVYLIDPSLIVGTRIINDDLVYDLNLKNIFEDLILHVSKNYD